jgi:hypothetical protein
MRGAPRASRSRARGEPLDPFDQTDPSYFQQGPEMKNFFDDIQVQHRSLGDIEAEADRARQLVGVGSIGKVKISDIMAALKIDVIPRPDSAMGRAAAMSQVDASGNRVLLRQSLFRDYELDRIEARELMIHETGHVFLHRGLESKPYVVGGNARQAYIREEESAENQAWRFERAFFLPRSYGNWNAATADIVTDVRISPESIDTRWQEMRLEIERTTERPSFRNIIEAARLQSRSSPVFASPTAAERVAAIEKRRLALWRELPLVNDMNPELYRLCHGTLIKWDHYLKPYPPSAMGWHMKHGSIQAYLEDIS